jgi:Skp family chaperone for outer membrane proteins
MMKKIIIAFFILFAGLNAIAQSGKGPKIGYIDMEYILEKSPDYAEAKNQLELKAAKWKQEMDTKRSEIIRLKEALQAEKALLTKELIEEREEEILYLEKDLSDYQQQKFGPNGELITQKAVLVKPIQDQVFTIVQDIAESRKYDFIFDKSSDLTMLFAAKKYDLSDLIVKRLSRAAKTEKLSSKEQKKLEEEERLEEEKNDPDVQEREKVREEKKAERERKLEERKAQKEQKIKEAEEKREQLKREREAKRNGTPAPKTDAPAGDDPAATGNGNSNERTAAPAEEKPAAMTAEEKREAAKAEKERKAEEHKQALEARRKELDAEREANKKKREDKKTEKKNETGTGTAPAQPTGDDELPSGGQ